MGRRQRVLLDVDGVLADFWSAAEKVVLWATGKPLPDDVYEGLDMFRSYDTETQSRIYNQFKQAGWCLALQPYPGAADFISRLTAIADVYFVTSPMDGPNWAHERHLWLKEHFNVPSKQVVSTNAKYLCVGDVFVDDKFEHIVNWQKAHKSGIAVLWNQPYNTKDSWDYRAMTYDNVFDFVFPG